MATTVTLKPNAIDISGSTSGTTTLQATAVAGTTTLTLPAATDTLVGRATTDTLTNKTLTGAAMNGTVGATTPSTVAATTLTTSSTITHNGGTANGVAYLDGSKVLTTGSALVFDGTNLGVGTSSPGSFAAAGRNLVVGTGTGNNGLTIYSGNASGGNIYFADGTTGAETYAGFIQYSHSTNAMLFGVNNTGSEAMTLDASGNLLVGGTSNAAGARLLSENATGNQLGLRYTSIATWYNSVDSSGNYIWTKDGTNIARFDASGNLLVGTTAGSSTEKFSVLSSNSSNNRVTAQFYNTAATSTTKLDNRLTRIASNGSGADVNIQFTDSVAHNYFFGGNNGGAYVVANSNGVRLSNGGTSWASDSDERLKDIIEPIINATEKVSSLRAVIGKYKTDEEDKRRTFLIAQDVQAVLPEAVFDEHGTLMLAYTDTIPLLVAAIKEQQALITQLTARITALEGA